MEIWEEIPNLNKLYFISNTGRIKSLNNFHYNKDKKIKYLKFSEDKYGYSRITIKNKNYFIHRLVAENFIPNPENKPQVNHKDGIKAHCWEDNLEWNTNLENRRHAYRIGLYKPMYGENANNHKLTEWDVKIIRKMYKNTKYWNQYSLANLFNISQCNIEHIVNYKSWKHIE